MKEALLAFLKDHPYVSYDELNAAFPDADPFVLGNAVLDLFDIPDTMPEDPTTAPELVNLGYALDSEQNLLRFREMEKEGPLPDDLLKARELAQFTLQKALELLPPGAYAQITLLCKNSQNRGWFNTAPETPPAAADRMTRTKSGCQLTVQHAVDKYGMQVDALFRNLCKLQQDVNEVYIGQTGSRGKSRRVHSVVTVHFPDSLLAGAITGLSGYDKAILNGVSSLLLAGTTYFTLPMLYHAMTGIENPTLDESAAQKLRERLELMRISFISIDRTEEVQAKFVRQDVANVTVENYLLPMSKISATLNGHDVEAYHLIAEPPLFEYASSKRQIAVVDLELLNAPLNNTIATIPMKNYILSRIEGMRNPRNQLVSHKILFASLLQELGEEDASKVRRKRLRAYMYTYLDYLTSQHYIRGYTISKTGRAIDGVVVRLYENDVSITLPDALAAAQAQLKNEKPNHLKLRTGPVHHIE